MAFTTSGTLGSYVPHIEAAPHDLTAIDFAILATVLATIFFAFMESPPL